jgi:hypothetical protein
MIASERARPMSTMKPTARCFPVVDVRDYAKDFER